MYKNKYIKYKNKYLNLISQIGGECDDGTDLTDIDLITQEQLNTRSPIDRITIDGHCYFVDELYQWILGDRNDGYNQARVTLPHNRSIIKRTDLERLIILHDNLPPGHSPNVSNVLLASARERCIQDEGPIIYAPEPVIPGERLYLYRAPNHRNRPRPYYIHARNNDNQIMYSGDVINTVPPTEFYICLCEITNPNNLPLYHNILYDVDVNYVGPC